LAAGSGPARKGAAKKKTLKHALRALNAVRRAFCCGQPSSASVAAVPKNERTGLGVGARYGGYWPLCLLFFLKKTE
jgi:hypothetical protein